METEITDDAEIESYTFWYLNREEGASEGVIELRSHAIRCNQKECRLVTSIGSSFSCGIDDSSIGGETIHADGIDDCVGPIGGITWIELHELSYIGENQAIISIGVSVRA